MNILSRSLILAAGVALLCNLMAPKVSFARTLRAGGTGATTILMNRLGDAFSARNPGISIEVIPSLGTSGAIEALANSAIDFAVAARALKPEEQARSLTGLPIGRTPFGFVTSYSKPPSFTTSELTAIYADPAWRWPDGTAVKIILRSKSDTDTAALKGIAPAMGDILDLTRKRSGIPVAATDQDNAKLAVSLPGTLATMTSMQVVTEELGLRFLEIDGVVPTIENLEYGRYPLERRFYLVTRAGGDDAVRAFAAFVRSPEGERILREAGGLPSPP
jgi:phosphate transport system substrate-binding protein